MEESKTALLPFTNENSLESLKRASLIFEKCALAFLTSIPRARRARFPLSVAYYSEEQIHRVSSELEWLFENGFLDSPEVDPFASGFEMEDFDRNRPVWVIRTAGGDTSFFQSRSGLFEDAHPELPDYERIRAETTELTIAGIQARIAPLRDHTLILSGDALLHEHSKDAADTYSSVLDIVLTGVPQPSAETPWEAILDWRRDKEAQAKFRRLKNWMNAASRRKDLDLEHLRDEVAYLLDEYQNYMKIQNAKFSSGALRTIVTTSAEILESIAKLKFKSLAEMPFKINDAHIALQEAELKAPGRELAYIVDAQRRFKQ